MKIAVLGLGVMGSHHARVYKELGVLGAVYDIDQTRVSDASGQYGVPGFQNLDAFLQSANSLGIVASSVAVPTLLHLPIASKCMTHGLDVFVEKPICDSIEDAEAMISLAEELNKILAIGYIERFNPAYLKLKSIVADKDFGEVISVGIRRVGGLPRSADNVIIDLMTHDFNLLLDLLGAQPERIFTHKHITNGIVDSAQVLLDFGSISATCEANWISPIKIRKIQVTGTKKCCDANMISQEVVENIGSQQHVFNFNKEPLREELVAFINAIGTRDTSKIVSGINALDTLRVTLSAANN